MQTQKQSLEHLQRIGALSRNVDLGENCSE